MHCGFNREIRTRAVVPGAVLVAYFVCAFRDGMAGLRVAGWGSAHATCRAAGSPVAPGPSHTRTAPPSGEVSSRRFPVPAMRPMGQ